jgi:antitoxin ParD1/3/4
MNVSLTEELELFIQEQVASGMYHSNSEVIRDGLRLLKKFNTPTQDYKVWLNDQIDIGLMQADNGEMVSGDEAYERIQLKMNSQTLQA